MKTRCPNFSGTKILHGVASQGDSHFDCEDETLTESGG